MSDDDLIAEAIREASLPDTRLTRADLSAMLNKISRSPGGVSALAREAQLSVQFVSQVCNGHRDPSDRILAALGLRKEVRFVPARRGNGAPV